MIIRHNTIDNTYLVFSEEEWCVLEVAENHERGCLEVTHYGSEDIAVQTIK